MLHLCLRMNTLLGMFDRSGLRVLTCKSPQDTGLGLNHYWGSKTLRDKFGMKLNRQMTNIRLDISTLHLLELGTDNPLNKAGTLFQAYWLFHHFYMKLVAVILINKLDLWFYLDMWHNPTLQRKSSCSKKVNLQKFNFSQSITSI